MAEITPNSKKEKVLILYNKLFHYRLPVFELLSEKYDLTVAYSMGELPQKRLKFKTKELKIIKIKRIVYHIDNIYKISNNYDIVIIYGDIAWLKYSLLLFHKKRKFKILIWTIGVSASYNKKYNEISSWDSIRDVFYKRADGIILYSSFPIKKYLENGYHKDKLFVAPNTVKVATEIINNNIEKDSILFIGSLYVQKGIMILLDKYYQAYKKNKNIIPLNIIGEGAEYKNIGEWINKNNLNHKIHLLGKILDPKRKAALFSKAIACISPNQAGLSVLESMGYGVPFITMYNAITGGERMNIQNGVNGILLDNLDQIEDILIEITKNKCKYILMGKKAREHYLNNNKLQDMVNGLSIAIDNTLSK